MTAEPHDLTSFCLEWDDQITTSCSCGWESDPHPDDPKTNPALQAFDAHLDRMAALGEPIRPRLSEAE